MELMSDSFQESYERSLQILHAECRNILDFNFNRSQPIEIQRNCYLRAGLLDEFPWNLFNGSMIKENLMFLLVMRRNC